MNITKERERRSPLRSPEKRERGAHILQNYHFKRDRLQAYRRLFRILSYYSSTVFEGGVSVRVYVRAHDIRESHSKIYKNAQEGR